MRHVTAAEANRNFSKLRREVAAGEAVVITSRGHPVARLLPAAADGAVTTAKVQATNELIAALRAQPTCDAPRWTRDDLYADEPYPETFR